MNAIPLLLVLSMLTGLPASVHALEMGRSPAGPVGTEPLNTDWIPIDPSRLAMMRGGLRMPSGLMLSFGIERLVYVNGELVASASLHIADVSRITTEQAQALAAINDGMVVQVGEGNRFDTTPGAGMLVIQNTLDGQTIHALTTLDVSVGTLGTLQELNTYSALHNALINAPGSP